LFELEGWPLREIASLLGERKGLKARLSRSRQNETLIDKYQNSKQKRTEEGYGAGSTASLSEKSDANLERSGIGSAVRAPLKPRPGSGKFCASASRESEHYPVEHSGRGQTAGIPNQRRILSWLP
jgi:hypothetical protein